MTYKTYCALIALSCSVSNLSFAQSTTLSCETGYYLQSVDENNNLTCVPFPTVTTTATTTTTTTGTTTCAAGYTFLGFNASGGAMCTQNPAFKLFANVAVTSLTPINQSCVAGNIESVSTNCTWNASNPLSGPNGSDSYPCRSFTSPCQAAAHNWCSNQGFYTGMVVDTANTSTVNIHCWAPMQ